MLPKGLLFTPQFSYFTYQVRYCAIEGNFGVMQLREYKEKRGKQAGLQDLALKIPI